MESGIDSMTTRLPGSIARVLERWADAVGWETLLNRSGTTFRKLPDAQKDGLRKAKAIKLMVEQPIDDQATGARARIQILVGFSPDKYSLEEIFRRST